MRFRKRFEKVLKRLAIIVVAGSVGAFFFLRWENARHDAPPPKQQTGYKEEDRRRLEKLIHEEGKDD